MPSATLFLDVVSPWSYFALAVLKRYKPVWGLNVVLKPTFLGGVMQASGNKPPISVKNKGLWMNGSDLPLASEFYQLPYTFPTAFPISTIHLMRVLRAVEEKYGQGEVLDRAVDVFFAAIWQPSPSLPAVEAIKPSSIPTLLQSVFPSSPDEAKAVFELSTSELIKGKLKSESEAVVEKEGAFGFPWIVIERDDGQKRSFFGSDRFEQIAFWLGKEWRGPCPDEQGVRKAKL
ncbi:hypothetical protein JCM8097_004261 [Rhodosporidiobolus ruineniae]